MKRLTFYICEKVLAALKRRQEKTGAPVAEQIRRAIDNELARDAGGEHKRDKRR